MGIVNVTPDSFSDGGRFSTPRWRSPRRSLVGEGADVSTSAASRRGRAPAVAAEVEIERVAPVVAGLVSAPGAVPVSIDTSKLVVAEAALDAGASMVNDVTAFGADPQLAALCAERGCEVVLMHMRGTPRTMQENPVYDDVVDDVKGFLAERIAAAVAAGVAEDRIWIDPGIGFGKTLDHNLELLRRLEELASLGRPIVVGTSRKSFIGKLTGREVGDRLGGTVATNVLAAAAGAEMLRVHEVAPMRDALLIAAAISGRGEQRFGFRS